MAHKQKLFDSFEAGPGGGMLNAATNDVEGKEASGTPNGQHGKSQGPSLEVR